MRKVKNSLSNKLKRGRNLLCIAIMKLRNFLYYTPAICLFFYILYSLNTFDCRASITSVRDDELIMLKAQNGYLKHKLAKLQSFPNPNDKSVPTIYVITPTYYRPVQKAELTRLCHTFLLGKKSFLFYFVKSSKILKFVIFLEHKFSLY